MTDLDKKFHTYYAIFAILIRRARCLNKVPRAWATIMIDSFIDFLNSIYFIGAYDALPNELVQFEYERFIEAYS